jgi:DNA-binding IclR family transcriptional regulator
MALAPAALRPGDDPPHPALRKRSAELPAVDERELSLVRRRGYAENVAGWIEGLAVYAGPVFLHARMVGAVAVALPTAHLVRVDRKQLAERVVRAAGAVSDRMAGRPSR